jgi:N-sulfoglucosamine sulfohydrolase
VPTFVGMRFSLLALMAWLTAMGVAFGAPKNIVFFIVDDMSPDTGAYGNPVIKTPHLDALAEDGTLFSQAFATTASCSASRSVVLTGLHNHANGQYGHQHAFHGFESWLKVRGLPILLEECGYRTAQIGKLHVAPQEVYRFQEYLKGDPRQTVGMAENCEDFISSEDDRPFFLYFATSDPHRGGGVDRASPYKPDLFGNLQRGRSRPGHERVNYPLEDVIVPPFLSDTPETRAELSHYYTSISRIDQGVGKLVDILKKAGKWEDTLFVFTADHGMAFAGAKTTVYEPGLRVPFIVRQPYLKDRPKWNHAMISHIDIAPSLLDFAGGYDAEKGFTKHPDSRELGPQRPGDNRGPESYDRFHGRSWLPILGETEPQGWDEIGASHTFHEIQMYYPMRVLRDRRYKLIWNVAHGQPYPFASDLWAAASWQAQWKKGSEAPYGSTTVDGYIHRPQFELFRVATDPTESINLARDPDYASVLEDMKKRLKALQRDTGDPWALKWKYE